MLSRRFVKSVLWFLTSPFRRWRYLFNSTFLRLAAGMHWTTAIEGSGNLDCSERVVIGRRTKLIFAHSGHLILRKNVWLGDDCEIGVTGLISIGSHTSLQHRSIVLGDVTIGAGCACGANLYVSSSSHHFEDIPELPIRWQDAHAVSRARGGSKSAAVVVGDDCWIGINVVIAPGVTIGRGCIIGANSVVTKDIRPYSVAAGVPARVLRTRLDFVPPRSLKANQADHIPYFYKGFIQWSEGVTDLEHALVMGGWPVDAEFAVAIRVEEGSTVEVSVLALAKGRLSHGMRSLEVGKGSSTVSFVVEPRKDGLVAFKWSSDGTNSIDDSSLLVFAIDQK